MLRILWIQYNFIDLCGFQDLLLIFQYLFQKNPENVRVIVLNKSSFIIRYPYFISTLLSCIHPWSS